MPPEVTCDPSPSIPTADELAGPNGDAALAVYLVRLNAWGRDCADAVDAMNKWRADHVPHS